MDMQPLSRNKKIQKLKFSMSYTLHLQQNTEQGFHSPSQKKSGQYLCLHVYHIVFKGQLVLFVFPTLVRSFCSIGSYRLKCRVEKKKTTNKVAEKCALIQLHLNIKISIHTQKGSLYSDKYQVAYTEDFHLNVSCKTFCV